MSLDTRPVAILTSAWPGRLSWITSWIPPGLAKPTNDILLVQALKAIGVQAELVVWNREGIDWTKYQACVVRSTWDYHKTKENTSAFLSTLQKIEDLGVVLLNPLSTIEWNINKIYLRELCQRGVSVIDTIWLTREELSTLKEKVHEKGWSNCVIKPVVSASGMHTTKFNPEDADKVAEKLSAFAVDTWMVQPFMQEIVQEGEISFIFIQNEFSHSVVKRPANGGFLVQHGTVNKFNPSLDLIEQAKQMLTLANQETLYARIDVILKDNKLVLMELELIEPSLFLQFDSNAAKRLATGITQHKHSVVL